MWNEYTAIVWKAKKTIEKTLEFRNDSRTMYTMKESVNQEKINLYTDVVTNIVKQRTITY